MLMPLIIVSMQAPAGVRLGLFREVMPRKMRLNSYRPVRVQFPIMRNLVLVLASLLGAATLEATDPPTRAEESPAATVPVGAAEAGKDVVHQLNSAFTKVFEIVAPTVVIIEITKKNDPAENPTLDDLF